MLDFSNKGSRLKIMNNLKILKIMLYFIGILGLVFHVWMLAFTLIWLTNLFPVSSSPYQISRIVLSALVSINIITNVFLIIGTFLKIRWMLKTWIMFAILQTGLVFIAFYCLFYAKIAVILTSLLVFCGHFASITIVDEFIANLNTRTSPAIELNAL